MCMLTDRLVAGCRIRFFYAKWRLFPGTGKTYTMRGKLNEPNEHGVIQRAVGMLLNKCVRQNASLLGCY